MNEINDDGLRARLARLDPVPPTSSVIPTGDPSVSNLLEEIMNTTYETPVRSSDSGPNRRLRWLGAAAAVVAIAGGAFALTRDGGGGSADPELTLTAPGGDPAMSMCIAFDPAMLAAMPVAFAGTIDSVSDTSAVIDVDRWYVGGDAESVEVILPGDFVALDTGLGDFEVGQRYLITATEGLVNGCGFSGLATPELEAAFAEAFPS